MIIVVSSLNHSPFFSHLLTIYYSGTTIQRQGLNDCHRISWRETLPEGSSLILSVKVVEEAAKSATVAVLKKAACSVLVIFKTFLKKKTRYGFVKNTRYSKENKLEEAYKQLGYDSSGLIIASAPLQRRTDSEERLSVEMRDILEDLLSQYDDMIGRTHHGS